MDAQYYVIKGKSPRVFVSYAWINGKPDARVDGMVSDLRKMGYDVKYDRTIKQGTAPLLTKMMVDGVLKSEKVIVVFSEEYKHKAESEHVSGVATEYGLILADILNNADKYIFVTFTLNREKVTPIGMEDRESIYIDLNSGVERYENLCRKLMGFPAIEETPLGRSVVIPKRKSSLLTESENYSVVKDKEISDARDGISYKPVSGKKHIDDAEYINLQEQKRRNIIYIPDIIVDMTEYDEYQGPIPPEIELQKYRMTENAKEAISLKKFDRAADLFEEIAKICDKQRMTRDAHLCRTQAFQCKQRFYLEKANIETAYFDKMPVVECLKEVLTDLAQEAQSRNRYAAAIFYMGMNASLCRAQGKERDAFLLDVTSSSLQNKGMKDLKLDTDELYKEIAQRYREQVMD